MLSVFGSASPFWYRSDQVRNRSLVMSVIFMLPPGRWSVESEGWRGERLVLRPPHSLRSTPYHFIQFRQRDRVERFGGGTDVGGGDDAAAAQHFLVQAVVAADPLDGDAQQWPDLGVEDLAGG